MRDKRAILVVGAALLAAVATASIVMTRDGASPAITKRALTPTADAIRYRFTALQSKAGQDPLSAIPEMEARVAASPSPFDASELGELYLRRAQVAGDPRDYDRAEQLAKQSLALLPAPNGAPLTLARVATARHEFRTAIQITRDYLETAHSTSAYTILTTAYLALGELPAAAEAAETQVAENPSSGAYLMRALVMQAQGRDVEAAYDFSRAVVVETVGDLKESARLRTLWGRFLLRRGDTSGAEMLVTEALRLVPADGLALAQRGEVALRSGHPREARTLFEQAFESSRQVRYLIDQARARDLSGDTAGANATRTMVERLVRTELEINGTGHGLDLVEILTDRAEPSDLIEAIRVGSDEVARRPSAEVRFQLARAYARSGKHRDGLIQIRAALATGARDARIYELASRLEAANGNHPRADMYRTLARELDPRDAGWRTHGMSVIPGAVVPGASFPVARAMVTP